VWGILLRKVREISRTGKPGVVRREVWAAFHLAP
jgi:hypothetical protein